MRADFQSLNQPQNATPTGLSLKGRYPRRSYYVSFMGRKPTLSFFTNVTPGANETYPIDDNRGSAEFKREMVKVLVRRAATQTLRQ
jgi:hypothetical protein